MSPGSEHRRKARGVCPDRRSNLCDLSRLMTALTKDRFVAEDRASTTADAARTCREVAG